LSKTTTKPVYKAVTVTAILLSLITAVTVITRQEDILPDSPLAANEIRVHYIDVGQGDAILIQSAQNAVLIDGGDTKTQNDLVNYLRTAGITTIDYVIATHPHTDHIGGLPLVVKQFEVKDILMLDTVVLSNTPFKQLVSIMGTKGIKFSMPAVGDTFAAGIIKFTALAPVKKKYTDINDLSIVIRMVHGETAFLFTGDAESVSERDMLSGEQTLRSDVLKAGHHGSRSSTTPAFLDAVHPSVVVISCGLKNTYGHPDKETLKNITAPERNITLFRTDEDGTVVISTDGQKITLPPKKETAHAQVLGNRSDRKQYCRVDLGLGRGNVGVTQKRIATGRERGITAVSRQ